jgi:hypothetical protein
MRHNAGGTGFHCCWIGFCWAWEMVTRLWATMRSDQSLTRTLLLILFMHDARTTLCGLAIEIELHGTAVSTLTLQLQAKQEKLGARKDGVPFPGIQRIYLGIGKAMSGATGAEIYPIGVRQDCQQMNSLESVHTHVVQLVRCKHLHIAVPCFLH